jgi:uncharacterized protein (TIGR03000 family)
MMSFLLTVAMAGAAPAQGYGGYAGYGEYGGYGWNAWGTLRLPCCLPEFYPALAPALPAPGRPSAPEDVDRQLEQKLKQMKEVLEALEKRLKDLDKKQKKFEKKQKRAEEAIETLAVMHEEIARQMEHKLAELQIMSRTLELKMGEESLRQKTEAFAQRQEMARMEDSLRNLEKKPTQDVLARTMIRDLDQQIAGLDAIMKTKIEVIEDRVGLLAKKAQEERLRQHFTRLDERMRAIEEHFQKGQKAEEKPAFLSNRALVTVRLPAATAKLFVNDRLVQGESAQRSFLTPELKIGTTYSYTLRMEVMRNGVPTSASQVVYFRAGKEVHASFEEKSTSSIRPAVSP